MLRTIVKDIFKWLLFGVLGIALIYLTGASSYVTYKNPHLNNLHVMLRVIKGDFSAEN